MDYTNPVMPHVNRQSFQIRRRDRDSVPGRGACGRLVAEGISSQPRGFQRGMFRVTRHSAGKVIPCLKPASDEISTLDHGVTRSSELFSSIVVVDGLCRSNQLKITV